MSKRKNRHKKHLHAEGPSRFRYALRYTTFVWNDDQLRNVQTERKLSVPFLWMGWLLMQIRREAWFMGGSLKDTQTGDTLYHINLAGNIMGDGRAHVVAGPAPE